MQYQLILQFPFNSSDDYDALVELEAVFEKLLRGTAEVDGHDAGAGEMNVFIFTADPHEIFRKIKSIMAGHRSLGCLKIAYRLVGTHEFTILWPPDLKVFDVQ